MTEQWSHRIQEILWPQGPRRDIWVILDAARDRRVYPLLLGCHLDYVCLYADPVPPDLVTVAPYLVHLDHGYRDTDRLIREAWGNSWGVFFRCDSSETTVRKHLRAFLLVKDSKGTKLVFRYYDPRVLRTYLPTCLAAELAEFFGPIQCFWTEGKSAGNMVDFRLEHGKLVRNTLPLDSPAPASLSQTAVESAHETQPRQGLVMLRETQVAAFSQAEVRKFEDWMLGHLTRFFPVDTKPLGDRGLRDLVRYGIGRAAAYGVKTRKDVCKYIDLMVVLGRDFDRDRRYPWVREILDGSGSSAGKMQAAFQATELHLGRR